MSMKQLSSLAASAACAGLSASFASASIPTVTIGNPGNAVDPLYGGQFGAVAYTYNIGTTEVTNAQYAAFLNAVAATDSYGLYNSNMGITRSGSSGSYTYSPAGSLGNHPVTYVSFWDAARFANWLHNGQGNGDTETGAYTLGGIASPANNTVTRNPGWQWAVASNDEWYKAAYHQPASLGGDADNYWLYPTSSNSSPQPTQANILGSGINNTVPVSTFPPNFYGTYDMAGNVREWHDTITQSGRTIRGGGFFNFPAGTGSDLLDFSGDPGFETFELGFRVSQIPEPSAIAVLAISGLLATRRHRVRV